MNRRLLVILFAALGVAILAVLITILIVVSQPPPKDCDQYTNTVDRFICADS